jgi:hypothetical protein
MSVTIKKASIYSGLFLKYSYTMWVNDVKNTNSTSSDAPIHNDLRVAFRNLIPFFAHICEEILDENLVRAAIEDPETHLQKNEDDPEDTVYPLLKYQVKGFTIDGKDGDAVTLIGEKWLASGDYVPFATPSIRFDSDYKFSGDLNSAVELVKSEVFEYMQGKQAPKQQQYSLLEDEDTDFE